MLLRNSMKKKKKQSPIRSEVKAETTLPSETAMNNRITWAVAISVAIITFLVYLPGLKNNFVNWDDGIYVYENNAIRTLDSGFLKWAFTNEVAGLWHPVTMLSFALNYAVGGLESFGYHLVNNLFHALNTFLVFVLTFKVVKQYNADESGVKKAVITGIVTSLLFGIHPIHVESVAWVSERKDVLSAFFYLLSLLTYVSYASANKSRKHFFYWGCLAFFALAVMSKPMAVSLPIVLLILDFYPLGRLTVTTIRTMLIEKLPFFLLSLLASSATIWAHLLGKGLPSLEQFTFFYRVLTAVRGYMFYIVKMILPFDLAPLYPLPSQIMLFSMEYLGPLMLWLMITFLSIWLTKKSKLFFVVWGYYIVTLIPVIGIIQVGRQAAADRYTYLPSIGLFFLAGLGVAQLCQRLTKKQVLIVFVAVIVPVLGILTKMTVQQIAIWKDSLSLWSHEIRIFPHAAPIVYNYRALFYDKSGNSQQAMQDYNKAIELDPQLGEVYDNRGSLYFTIGDHQSAMRDYNKAIELNPQYDKAYYNRGTAYNSLNYYHQAIEDFTKAIELNPKDSIYYTNRGSAYNSIGSNKEAVNDYITAIELNPKDAYAYYNLGNVYSQTGNMEQALVSYKKAADLGLKEAQDMLSDIKL